MKKVVSFMKVLALLIVPVLLIASCNGKEDPTTSIPTDHVHSYTEEVIAPTCTEDGYTLHKCSCGDSYKDTTVAKLGHSFGAWKVTVEPTNTKTGSKERECQTCHVKETQVVPVRQTEHTHTYDNWQVAKNPTDKAEGLLVRNCIAEDKSETFVLPTLNTTDYTKGDESVDSTCSVAGVYEYVYTKDEQAFSFKVALQRLEHELETKTKKATCTESGYVRTTCKNCDYKVEETTKPLGHTWDHDEASCDYAKTCTVCHTVGEAQKTHHALAVTTPATCEQAGKIVYTCEYCNKKLSEEAIPALGHDYSNWNQIGAEQKNSKCEVIQHYSRTCTLCNHEESYDDVLRVEHNYTSEVTTEALCNKAGTITYTCLDCGASYEKNYENTSAHSFVSKGIKNNIETFKCSHCDATKTVLSYKDKTEANVNKENLNNEIELKNASIVLDENTVNALPQNITIKADTVNKDDLRLNDSYADAIGNNTIYNFGMNSGEDAISSFDGKVTVRVPYELKAGENPDEIAIWYINDEGAPTAIKAKYANGFAEFETNHFSYYTVIRLSGEDRCKVYEHDYMIKHIDGDCFHDSYDLNTCRYCGRVEKANVIHHTGHVYNVVENVAATCVQAGYTTYKCANCDSEYKTYILPVGHSYELQDGSIKATCTNAGLEKYECSVCHDKYETALAQQSHQFNDVVTKATCTLQGLTVDEIVELVNKYIKLDGDKTIEQIINEFLGNTSGSLVDYLKSDLFRKANLFETINKLLKNNMKIEIDFVSYIKMALEAIDEYKDYTIKDFIEMAGLNINLDEIFKVIDGYIERYKDILDITISTDYVGNITSLKVTTKGTVNDDDYWTADGDISIDFTFNDNVVIEDDFTGLVDNIISLDIPALFKENYKNLVKDDDGNIIGFFSEDKDSDTGNRTEGQFTYETIYTRHTKNYIYFNKNTYIDSFTIDCGNWSKIQYSGCFKKEEKYYTTVYNTYYKGNLIDTHTETSNPSYWESSSSSFTFFFNVKTQKFIFNNSYRDTMHDFRLTNHVDSNGCGTYATDVYVCADCGYTKTKYSFEGHKFTGEETYELINPNGTCKDGVKVYQLCDQCQKNVLKYTNHYHSSWHEEYKLKDGATSCEDGIIVSRVCNLCGAVDSTYETNNHRTTEKEISLADYGFKGNLTISECACGQIKNAYFSGDYDNSKKEYLDEKVTIDGIDYNAEVTTYYYGENAFVIRRLTATVENENCQAVSITLYQYGYKDNGSSLYEIKEQNETYSHKPQMFEETKENGDGTSTITQTWKCTECSTITYVTIYEYDSNRKLVTHITQDYSGSGMLSSIYTEKYTYINGKQFIIFVRTEELNSWSQKEIKPDIDRCMQIVTYTSSNGQSETTEETHHFDVTVHPASCTQPGYSVCNKCGETLYDQYPHRHKFDYVAGHWKCSYCGLESDNTNNGIIVLEELELESESQNTLSYGYCFDRYSGVDAIFSISIIIDNKQYSISYTPDTTTHIYSDNLIYGQINIDLATLNSEINTLIKENNLEVESIILSVNALDANSQYFTSITLSYSLNA